MSRILSKRFVQSRRLFTTSTVRGAFAIGPAPPRLPPKEQEEFERLQRSSTGAFSTPKPSISTTTISASSTSSPAAVATSRTRPQINQSPASTSEATDEKDGQKDVNARVAATGKGEELHPDVRRGAKPEFEG